MEDGKSSAPQTGPVTGQQTARTKETREQRKERRKLEQRQAEVAVAAGEVAQVLQTAFGVKSSGPQNFPVTVLETPQQVKERLRSKRESEADAGNFQAVMGRPSEYSEEEADTICAWVAGGGSLRRYSRETGRPMITVYRWMREVPHFGTRYAVARMDRADTRGEEIIEIADAAALTPTIEGVAAAKLQVDARKWVQSKDHPGRWGDKQIIEHKGAVNIRLGIPARQQQLEVLEEVKPDKRRLVYEDAEVK